MTFKFPLTIITSLILLAWAAAACAIQPSPVETTTEASPTAAVRPPSETPPPASPTPEPVSSPSPVPTQISSAFQICTPLENVELEELPHMINNPYHPPPPGSDDPHYGVDFTDLDPVTQLAIEGRAVQAVLPGKVALVIVDRFPYGNAVLVETQLEDIPAAVLQAMDFPAQVQEIQPDPALTCPDRTDSISWNPEHLTLYLLYAHLQEPPHVQPEDEVECGQVLGKVGGSGNALNPHLHLEIRAGPAGARLDGMAHYDASASAAEMRGYCDWRVSGWFSPLDPMKLLAAQE